MSKFSLDVLERRVFPFAKAQDTDIVLGAAFGEDVALTRVGGDILVSHVDPIVGAIGNIGWLAVHVACNDVATSGVPPRWILLLVMVPRLEVRLYLIVPMPLWLVVSVFFVLWSFVPGVAWQAHLGGLVAGLVAGYIFKKQMRYFIYV